MLAPSRSKFRKQHRGRMRGVSKGATSVDFGDFGLQALEPAWITDRQIEACRVALTHFLKKGGKMWLRIFPDKPYTKKPAETRMGKGKGEPDHWVAVVKRGRIMFEVAGIDEDIAREAVHLASYKLPIAISFAMKEGQKIEG